MICPLDGSKDYDELDCQDCKYYQECFNVNQDDFKKDNSVEDNFPEKYNTNNVLKKEDLTNAEQEIRDSIKWIGNNYTWEIVEAMKDAKTRLRYRMIFIKLGGTIPEGENAF